MKNFLVWTDNAFKLGDMLSFLQYLEFSSDKAIISVDAELQHLGLPTFNIIQEMLKNNFPDDSKEYTTLQYLITKEEVTSFDLCYCFKVFNTQRSILFDQGSINDSIAIKALLSDEDYKNEWLSESIFKYYLFSRVWKGKRDFNPEHAYNRELLKENKTIYLFLKAEDRIYHFAGAFKSIGLFTEESGAKYIKIQKI